MFRMPKVIFFLSHVHRSSGSPVHRWKLQNWDLVISGTYFILFQEIACLLWPLSNEELWISRGYEVCAAATMEPGGHPAGIFHLAFSLQEMIFPGMRCNLWAKVGDRSHKAMSLLSAKANEMQGDVKWTQLCGNVRALWVRYPLGVFLILALSTLQNFSSDLKAAELLPNWEIFVFCMQQGTNLSNIQPVQRWF